MTAQAHINRLRWHCRRGSLELDLILGQFLAQNYAQLSAVERADFEHLLAQPDQSLIDWLSSVTAPPDNLKFIVNKILYKSDY